MSYNALSEIINAKKEYAKAEKAGDENAKAKANQKANAIRKNSDGYTGGDDGSEYNKEVKDYEIRNNSAYNSSYADDISRVKKEISSKADFSYSPDEDPIYQMYKNIYLKLGNDAYERAMSESALRTGGIASSAAQSAAMQENNRYNSMLAAKVPELYKLAYDKYSDEYDNLYKELDALSGLENDEYKRYRDTVSDFESDRDYFYKKDKNDTYNTNSMYKYDTDLEHNLMRDTEDNERYDEETAYRNKRDIIDDGFRQQELDLDKDGLELKKIQTENDKLNVAVNIAKALYGRVPVSQSVITRILSMLE